MKAFQDYFNQDSLLAKTRKFRPFISKDHKQCPFCPAHEKELEKIITETWHENKLWARIIANKYPVTSLEGPHGFHDVVIDTASHTQRGKDFSVMHWQALLKLMHDRWLQLMKYPEIKFIQIFKNDGTEAGASISHSHWQIVSLERLPLTMQRKYERYNSSGTNKCYLCQIPEELLLFESTSWQVMMPAVPEYNGEVWLVPKRHFSHYGQIQQEELTDLGRLFKRLLMIYDKLNPGTSYNICFMSGELTGRWPYHFHIKLMMRSGRIAGFEIATGCHIITQPPEDYRNEIKKLLKGMYT